ncbi:MAG: Ig-like domain-containing protein [Sphingobacteriales bacterium]|nr:Ig-like domain-containing protein [Sphingobacteriales bacterium]MBI3720885.1 Ig-like domain-containing protein [Sphingobacteriales bacterium]
MKGIRINITLFGGLILFSISCKKNSSSPPPGKPVAAILVRIDNVAFIDNMYNVGVQPVITIKFSEPLQTSSVASAVKFQDGSGSDIGFNSSLQSKDSLLVIQPNSKLAYISKYKFSISTTLKSASGGAFTTPVDNSFLTKIDSTPKFPVISDDSLLTVVQKQTFKYFWDFGHPVCGMARERNADLTTVTTGGSGFGIMATPVAINRGFITRADGLARLQTIVGFLKNTAPKFHGAFSHWMNGNTGAVIPFGVNDDGADIVETSYLMAGLLTARQFFDGADVAETTLRSDINALYNAVEWDWFRQNGKNVLYWNWSPNTGFAVNVPVQGWNETLITYVMAASSPTHSIPKAVYDSGFARNGAMVNNNTYYGYKLSLGPAYGGPLFFSHYSFMGINPNGLSDAYANYQTQTINHSLINYEYCKANPKNYYGYSNLCWGLTASDVQGSYNANSPTNDVGVITPTAAISSLPYTPAQSMNTLKFFYYTLGDKIWKDYGFTDAFSLNSQWYASSFLAIDQGPIIVMIENYRSGLVWNLFTSCPEVKAGMKSIGFSAPYL